MRISRRKRPDKPLIPRYKKNTEIDADFLLVLDEDGESLGQMPKRQAIDLALEREVDLVEINPKSDPPVARLIAFAEFKYQKEKEAKKKKAHSHVGETKGIRLSVRISEHDLVNKQTQAEKFLNRGDKVKVELMMKGRENARPELAYETVRDFFTRVQKNVEIKVEQEPTRQGKKVIALIIKK